MANWEIVDYWNKEIIKAILKNAKIM